MEYYWKDSAIFRPIILAILVSRNGEHGVSLRLSIEIREKFVKSCRADETLSNEEKGAEGLRWRTEERMKEVEERQRGRKRERERRESTEEKAI